MKSSEGIMKTWVFVALFAVAGVALGFGATIKQFGWFAQVPKSLSKNPEQIDTPRPPSNSLSKRNPNDPKGATTKGPRGSNTKVPPPLAPPGGPQPQAVVPVRRINFGIINKGDTKSHEFVITNNGEYPLELRQGKKSCACTLSKLPKDKIAPGESIKVNISVSTRAKKDGFFRVSAEILSNDLENRSIKFELTGVVKTVLRLTPTNFAIGEISSGEKKTVEIKLLSYLKTVELDQLKITDFNFTLPKTASFFDVKITTLPKDQLGDSKATSGCLIALTVDLNQKEGSMLPTGYIHQSLRVRTNIPGKKSPSTIRISGTVRSDLLISGKNFSAVTNVLNLGSRIMNSTQVEKFLDISIQGPRRDKMKLNITSVWPKWIAAELQESQFKNSKSKRFHLLIAIPEGSPAANFQGPDKKKMGKIVIETTHPDIKTLEIYLNFSVVIDPAKKKKIEANNKVDEEKVKKQDDKDQNKGNGNKDQEAPETNKKDPPDSKDSKDTKDTTKDQS